MSRDYVLQTFRPPVELNIDYARELNMQQHAAVTAPPGSSLVIAGAGSGKTRTLTYRVAFLLEQGVPPESILLLTFTNKAAKEMMRRVVELLGHELPELWGGTFHSIGNRVLRRHADRLGFERNFAILDREDARDLLQACLGDAAESRKIDLKATRFPKADVLGDIFSLAVNMQKPVAEILASHHHHFLDLAGPITELQRAYTERKRATNAMDFDDLLVLWLRLLREHADVLEFWQRRCQFILVDEYQDTNQLQGGVIDLLGARHHNVMVVGDDAQSIYAWRGANFRNILEFPKRYPNTAVYRIETNYRSTPEILALANSAIAPNVNQFAKELAPARKSGIKPALVACEDSDQQAAFVAQRVLELREEGTPLDHIAVLYRSHFHALELQLHLTRRNIPFSITSGIRFFEQAHVKDVAAYLKFVCNPRDEISFKRLVQLLPGIGGKGAAKLWNNFMQVCPGGVAAGVSPAVEPGVPPGGKAPADSQGLEKSNAGPGGKMPPSTAGGTPAATTDQSDDPDWDVTPSLAPRSAGAPPASSPRVSRGDGPSSDAPPPLATALQRCVGNVPKKAATAWAQLTATISQLETPPVMGVPGKMIELVLEAGYEDHLQETYANHEARMDDLKQLAVFARQFPTLEEFLTQLALLTNVEAEAEEAATRNDDERLRLSTIHQAKGLEFDAVFVIMLCDGLFPSSRSIDHEEALEEERRLFYVAITRAKNELYLSHPLMRLLAGAGTMMMQPSRFLHEIQRDLVEEWNLQSNRPWV